jgi:heterodisulfide reductase subunit A
MAVAKARLLISLKRVEIDVVQKALVIGGGIAGMVSSLSLAEQGFEVFLVEKETELGGNLRHIYYTIEGRDVQRFLRRTIEKIKDNKLIKVFTNANIESISGYIGNYETEISFTDGTKEEFKHGVKGYQDIRISDHQAIRLSNHPTIRLWDYPTIRL